MPTRLRLLKGANALLYVGPLFAGISGTGFGTVAPFVAIFVLWLVFLRPEQWPATSAEWLAPQAIGAVMALVLSQVLLVFVLLGIGRGLGAVAGFLPAVNPIIPLTLSCLAIPLCRALWDARAAADRGIFLDEEAEAAYAQRVLVQAAAAVVPLLELSDGAPDAEVTTMVGGALDVAKPELRLDALVAALEGSDRSHGALRRALVLWLSEPEVVAFANVPKAMATAFALAAGNGDLLRLYVPRALALVTAFPGRASAFPTPADLRRAATGDPTTGPGPDLPAHLRADLRDGLAALARAVEAALRDGAALAASTRDPVARAALRTA